MQLKFTSLIYLLFVTLGLSAQVGVNNPNPEQALDVTGKIKVGDDATAPSDGTIRYNGPEGSFEGYADGEWESLNKSAAPENPIPFLASVFTTFQAEGYVSMEYQRLLVNQPGVQFDANGGTSFPRTVVPAGYLMVVDYIHVVAMRNTGDEQFLVEISEADGDATTGDELDSGRNEPLIYVSGTSSAGPAKLGNGRAPLLVVRPGNQLTLANQSGPGYTGGVRVVFTGFLVQDLDQYFTY